MSTMRKRILVASAVVLTVIAAVLIFPGASGSGGSAADGKRKSRDRPVVENMKEPGPQPKNSPMAANDAQHSEIMTWLQNKPKWRPLWLQSVEATPEPEVPSVILEKQARFEALWND